MILFFDTETTGFPAPRLTPDDPRQCHLVQLAAVLTEEDGTERACINLVVAPPMPVPAEAAAVHGLTTEVVARSGVSERTAILLWHQLAARSRILVAHNIGFDLSVLEMAFRRLGRADLFVAHRERERRCTMEAARRVVNLPPTPAMVRAGRREPKAPKLHECVRHFWAEDLEGAHDALVDVRACARVYFHLGRLTMSPQRALV